jgi:hypothetical protein
LGHSTLISEKKKAHWYRSSKTQTF